MVIGTHRVMLLCVIVLLTGFIFGRQAVATDSRVTELANKAGIRILRDSSSDKKLQKTATSQVPLARMSQRSQQRAIYLLNNTSQYRRMHSLQYEVDASLYQYLINHPDVAIATWRVMGISKLNMWQTAPFEYAAKANDGSKGQADVLWRDANQCLFVVEGAYHSPLLPSAIEASALVWMRYRFERTRDNRILVNQQIETFINFPSPAIEAIAKLASMVTNSILDRNVMEVSLYAQMMSRALKRDPNWVEEVAARMDSVPEHRKIELTRVARGINPYEPQNNGRIASQTKPQTPQLAAGLANTGNLIAADKTAQTKTAQTMASKNAGQALSQSKQQLLQAVQAGNVVVIVKQTPNTDPASAASEADAVSVNSVSLSKPSPSTPALTAKEMDSLSKLMGAAKDEIVEKAIPFLTNQSTSAAKASTQLAASGPITAASNATQSLQLRNVYTGYSKDGSYKISRVEDLATGPSKRPSGTEDNGEGDAEETVASTSTVGGSNGGQPALITVPPPTASANAGTSTPRKSDSGTSEVANQ